MAGLWGLFWEEQPSFSGENNNMAIKNLEKIVHAVMPIIGAGMISLSSLLSGCDKRFRAEAPVNQSKLAAYNKGAGSITGGEYSLDINTSPEAVVAGIGGERGERAKFEFIKRHSGQNLWTYEFTPQQTTIDSGKIELPKIGKDNFIKEYNGKDLAQINIVWSPITTEDVKKDFDESVALHKTMGVWVNGSDKDIVIDNNNGRYGQFKVPVLEGTTAYGTFVVLHANNRRYQIQFTYTKGFSDPDNTFEKIKKMKLGVKEKSK